MGIAYFQGYLEHQRALSQGRIESDSGAAAFATGLFIYSPITTLISLAVMTWFFYGWVVIFVIGFLLYTIYKISKRLSFL
jgi:hypothetical protein